ncbi:hypothetical protein RB195_003716 [Necator americanus]|uniref:SXP/RAL-2 family protein Ani s 5-like cation-binding domain-containing protein n=1 Tax=Necator americanus TaxID=51031 RepID=A0ABR1DPV0_NECAM
MQPLFLLGVIGLVAAQYFPFPNPPLFPIPPHALGELHAIWNDPKLTKQQFEEKMKNWAEKNGKKTQYEDYKKKVEKEKKELEEGLKEVSRYFRKVRETEKNESPTYKEFANKIKDLFSKLTKKQKGAVRFLECLFAPSSSKSCVSKPIGPAPFGPGPIGPAPFGPGPIGPAPFVPGPIGPIPFAPAPYGPFYPPCTGLFC